MATADHTTSEKSMSKTVNIVCYLKAGAEEDRRDVMDRLDDSRDYHKTETRERDRYYAVTRSGVERIDESLAQKLDAAQGEELMVRHKVEERENHPNDKWTFSSEFSSSILRGLDKVPPSLDAQFNFTEKVKYDGRYIFKATSSGPESMGLLKHPSEVEDSSAGDVWDDKDAELWAVTLTVQIKDVSPTVFRFYDNKVTPEITRRCARHEWVERTRVMDCTKEMSEEGACYDVF